MRELLIPFALVNNKVKHIDNIYKQDEALCMECGSKLLLRNGDKNIKHLAHSADSNCRYKNEFEYKKRGGGESYYHKYAKEFLRDNLSFFRLYGNQIIIKDGEFKLGGYEDLKINEIIIEYRGLKEELKLEKNYIPDVLIRTDRCLIALEIYNSNKKIVTDISHNLKGKNIYVYEISISNIEDLNLKAMFRNMKLIFSNLKIEFENTMKPIQSKIVECNKLKNIISDKDEAIDILNRNIFEIERNFDSMIADARENKKVKYLENELKKLKDKDIENRKCWRKCVKDWYSAGLNDKINRDINRCEDGSEEVKLLKQFRCFYNGKISTYSNYGGDDKLKKIADITRGYDGAIKYLGMNNEMFKKMVGMNEDKGEEILRSIIAEDQLIII